jgi:hypothetical protein
VQYRTNRNSPSRLSTANFRQSLRECNISDISDFLLGYGPTRRRLGRLRAGSLKCPRDPTRNPRCGEARAGLELVHNSAGDRPLDPLGAQI